MGIRAGQHFLKGSARKLPIVVIVATSLRSGEAESLAREVERAQIVTGTFRPLFVIDTAEFGPFRRRGYVVERVMPPEELAAANPGDAHGDYLFERISSIVRTYGATSVVPVAAGSAHALDGSLLRLIGSVPPVIVNDQLMARVGPKA
jgi:hypothetical protein